MIRISPGTDSYLYPPFKITTTSYFIPEGDSSFIPLRRDSFGMTYHIDEVGGRSGDSQILLFFFQVTAANRRFFPILPYHPVIPRQSRGIFFSLYRHLYKIPLLGEPATPCVGLGVGFTFPPMAQYVIRANDTLPSYALRSASFSITPSYATHSYPLKGVMMPHEIDNPIHMAN